MILTDLFIGKKKNQIKNKTTIKKNTDFDISNLRYGIKVYFQVEWGDSCYSRMVKNKNIACLPKNYVPYIKQKMCCVFNASRLLNR